MYGCIIAIQSTLFEWMKWNEWMNGGNCKSLPISATHFNFRLYQLIRAKYETLLYITQNLENNGLFQNSDVYTDFIHHEFYHRKYQNQNMNFPEFYFSIHNLRIICHNFGTGLWSKHH